MKHIDSEQLLEVLRKLVEHGPYSRHSGLCAALDAGMHACTDKMFAWDEYEDLYTLFEKWPEYSGCRTFPVQHPLYDDPSDGYVETPNKWEGAYGEARWRLVHWMIGELSK